MPLYFTAPADRLFSDAFKVKIERVYSFFPELHHTAASCGAIRKRGAIQGTATSWAQPPVIRFRPGSSFYTIAHELTHLIQGNGSGVPQGEVQCDIWTVDRMPVEYLDEPPFYLLRGIRMDWSENKNAVKNLCRQAIEQRSSVRAYIVWLVTQIRRLQSCSGIA